MNKYIVILCICIIIIVFTGVFFHTFINYSKIKKHTKIFDCIFSGYISVFLLIGIMIINCMIHIPNIVDQPKINHDEQLVKQINNLNNRAIKPKSEYLYLSTLKKNKQIYNKMVIDKTKVQNINREINLLSKQYIYFNNKSKRKKTNDTGLQIKKYENIPNNQINK